MRLKLAAGHELSTKEILAAAADYFGSSDANTFIPLLGMLSLSGKAYSIEDHFPFEPIFSIGLPRRMLWKCGRQVSKSTSLAASGVLRCAGTPYLRILFVTPRFEQIRRLSTNYIRPFIAQSLIRSFLINEESTQAVLQRTFSNNSAMYFSFAFLDVDRIRGISADLTKLDEVQDIDWDFIPIIHECMSASQLGITFYHGTPKTLDNTIEALWQESSKAEWVTPCFSCGKWNMASIHEDLLKMIGLKTVVCAKCDKPINPRVGHWYHTDPERGLGFPAYHVPQVIMPMHYAKADKWADLLNKRNGVGGYSPQKFINEVLGESADIGVSLFTITDIQRASKAGRNVYSEAIEKIRQCRVRVLGVDWGGGGEEEVSFTTLALVGLDPYDGIYKCFYCERFHAAFTHEEEARRIMEVYRDAACHFLAHDYGGSGSVRETLIIQAGIPIDRILNFVYVRATTRNIVYYNMPVRNELRGYYSLDKARSLVLQATVLKAGAAWLPEYESSKDITHDLLNLMEDKHEMPSGSDVFLVRKRPKSTDDFAHAFNYALMGIYHTEQAYPDLSMLQGIKLTEEQLRLAAPPHPIPIE